MLTFIYKGGSAKLTAEQEKELKEHIAKSYYNDLKVLNNYKLA